MNAAALAYLAHSLRQVVPAATWIAANQEPLHQSIQGALKVSNAVNRLVDYQQSIPTMLYEALDTDLQQMSLDVNALAQQVHTETCAESKDYYSLPSDAVSMGVARYSSAVVSISRSISAITWHGVPGDAIPPKKAVSETDGDDVGTGAGGLVLEVLKRGPVRHRSSSARVEEALSD